VLPKLPGAERLVEALTTWLIMAVNYLRNRLVSIDQAVHRMGVFYEQQLILALFRLPV
jgi:hypothetical protein